MTEYPGAHQVTSPRTTLPPPLAPDASREGTVGYPSMPDERPKSQPVTVVSDIVLPGPQLTVPAARETQFPIRHADWLRIRRMITRLSDPLPNIANIGWACVGISSSAIIGYFPWIAADSELPGKAEQHYSYISPMLLSVSVSAMIVALFILIVRRKVAKVKAAIVEDILEDMDSLYEPYSRPSNQN